MIEFDEDNESADWLRSRSWDLPTDPEAFLSTIGGRENLAHFMTLPAARAMPDALRAAMDAIPSTLSLDEVAARDRLRDTPS